jgi:hypothetical protein
VDHRTALVRSVLNQVAPGWVQYREGIWGVRVRRSETDDTVDSGSDADEAVAHVAAPDEGGAEGESVVAETIAQPKPRRARRKPASEASQIEPDAYVSPEPPKRRGGRPKGSKNKPKAE